MKFLEMKGQLAQAIRTIQSLKERKNHSKNGSRRLVKARKIYKKIKARLDAMAWDIDASDISDSASDRMDWTEPVGTGDVSDVELEDGDLEFVKNFSPSKSTGDTTRTAQDKLSSAIVASLSPEKVQITPKSKKNKPSSPSHLSEPADSEEVSLTADTASFRPGSCDRCKELNLVCEPNYEARTGRLKRCKYCHSQHRGCSIMEPRWGKKKQELQESRVQSEPISADDNIHKVISLSSEEEFGSEDEPLSESAKSKDTKIGAAKKIVKGSGKVGKTIAKRGLSARSTPTKKGIRAKVIKSKDIGATPPRRQNNSTKKPTVKRGGKPTDPSSSSASTVTAITPRYQSGMPVSIIYPSEFRPFSPEQGLLSPEAGMTYPVFYLIPGPLPQTVDGNGMPDSSGMRFIGGNITEQP
ncbi:hypothetical protein M422DRAFT_42157 [Sphaerobolus stellatus SS14]|nr:hypothetical protein M422DRAFT_42157 [Sphaerobolus stellatus SS14]